MSKKPSTQPMPRIALIISRDSFKSELKNQISKGQQILSFTAQSEEQLKQQEKNHDHWSAYNYELLKNSFNSPNNDYKSGYNSAGSNIGIIEAVAGMNLNDPRYRSRVLRERLEAKISSLESILFKSDLILSEVEKDETLTTKEELNDSKPKDIFIIHGHDEEMKRNVQLLVNGAD